MKRNLMLFFVSLALLTTTGCLSEEEAASQAADKEVAINPREALILALDSQAVHLVDGLNKVVIEGKFTQNLSLKNPPKPIPMSDENEVNRAINYLFSNQTQNGQSFSYKPDSRLCSEIIAKENPASCAKVLEKVSFSQLPINETDGTVTFEINKVKMLELDYGKNGIRVRAILADAIKALTEVSQILQQNGEQGFAASLPTTYSGSIELTVSSNLSMSTIGFGITSALDIRGQNENAESYSLQAAASQNMLIIALDADNEQGKASIALPPVAALFTVHNEQNIAHQVEVSFPGFSVNLSLDNALELIAIQALKLTSPDAFVKVDGQAAAKLFSDSIADGFIKSFAGGDLSLSFLNPVSVDVEIAANPLMNVSGQIALDIAAATEVFFKQNSEQVKVLSGSIQIIGTDSFAGSMNAEVNMCIAGQQNSPLPINTVVCE